MTQPEQSRATSGSGDDGLPARSGQGEVHARTESASPPKRWPLWVWPPLAIGMIAVAGDTLGIAGAFATAGATVATLIFVMGDILYSGQRRRAVAVVAIGLAIIVLTVLMWQSKVPWIRLRIAAQATAPGPVDLRGITVTQTQAFRLDLRGAQLSGAVLNKLVLRDKQMQGIAASGASFRHADLSYASLRGADLNGTDFSYACLIDTDFTGAVLDGADVNNAILDIHSLPRAMAGKLIGIPVMPGPHQTRCSPSG